MFRTRRFFISIEIDMKQKGKCKMPEVQHTQKNTQKNETEYLGAISKLFWKK